MTLDSTKATSVDCGYDPNQWEIPTLDEQKQPMHADNTGDIDNANIDTNIGIHNNDDNNNSGT